MSFITEGVYALHPLDIGATPLCYVTGHGASKPLTLETHDRAVENQQVRSIGGSSTLHYN